ncbi:uncharacterized protein BDR25DRAFT_361146 [Lindgomyces ingoldianus]|uniref:Uncharacterized protein n=1 Tax=Lindgomyces ingoldianus TaxID=673940 RepID=A0ACB6QDK0_9PLEO|nr:uncharacterized protein BDR25DRAFT_361146 [Lindgomyces ingoldianus]KAF2464925.1 hypothetical protein BDR25DRAFT_361146 [Lindgomyces ingoldianus]
MQPKSQISSHNKMCNHAACLGTSATPTTPLLERLSIQGLEPQFMTYEAQRRTYDLGNIDVQKEENSVPKIVVNLVKNCCGIAKGMGLLVAAINGVWCWGGDMSISGLNRNGSAQWRILIGVVQFPGQCFGLTTPYLLIQALARTGCRVNGLGAEVNLGPSKRRVQGILPPHRSTSKDASIEVEAKKQLGLFGKNSSVLSSSRSNLAKHCQKVLRTAPTEWLAKGLQVRRQHYQIRKSGRLASLLFHLAPIPGNTISLPRTAFGYALFAMNSVPHDFEHSITSIVFSLPLESSNTESRYNVDSRLQYKTLNILVFTPILTPH